MLPCTEGLASYQVPHNCPKSIKYIYRYIYRGSGAFSCCQIFPSALKNRENIKVIPAQKEDTHPDDLLVTQKLPNEPPDPKRLE